MQNERNLHPFGSPRQVRTPSGRSCPASLGTDVGGFTSERPIPSVDERQGGRLCDGSLPRGEAESDRESCAPVGGWGLHSYPLAMAYAPLQEFSEVYSPDVALERGTLFPELDLPFEGYKRRKGGVL